MIIFSIIFWPNIYGKKILTIVSFFLIILWEIIASAEAHQWIFYLNETLLNATVIAIGFHPLHNPKNLMTFFVVAHTSWWSPLHTCWLFVLCYVVFLVTINYWNSVSTCPIWILFYPLLLCNIILGKCSLRGFV